MGISRARMFAPVPEKGLRSARVPALHARRATVPPLTTRAHLAGMLAAAEPAQTERELAELVREGVVRRVAVARAPEVVELLVLERDLEGMLAEGVARGALGEDVRAEFAAWLRDSPGESVVAPGALSEHAADALVREGFLTAQGYAHLAARGERERLRTRPDERGSIVSLDRIARAASGSDAAVGGRAALYEAGGGGPSSGRTPQKPGRGGQLLSSPPAAPRTTHPLDLAVPGQGPFLRLATAAVAHLVSLIQTRSRFAQAPESTLREWWDCATPPESRAAASARRRRRRQNSTAPLASATTTTTTIAGRAWTRPPGSYVGDVMPDRTTKWRLLDGIRFEWALKEAVGCGAVEVFDAGAVGKGVRVV
jgi:SulP family sulfate permease